MTISEMAKMLECVSKLEPDLEFAYNECNERMQVASSNITREQLEAVLPLHMHEQLHTSDYWGVNIGWWVRV